MSENEFEKVTPENEEVIETEAPVEETVEENEVIEETTEEAIEEAAEDVVEEAEEDFNESDNVVINEDVIDEVIEEVEETVSKKSKAPVIIAIIVVVLALAAYLVFDAVGGDKYNKMGYANPNGRTVEDVISELGITLDEFKANYSLPEDITLETEEMAAYYMIPVKVFAQMYGVDFDTFKQTYNIPVETTPSEPTTIIGKIKALFGVHDIQPIDENTPWGIVMDELTLGNYIGEENLETFKEYYGITTEITAETKYKEIRKQVEAKEAELVAEAKAAQEQAESEGADQVEGETEATDSAEVTPEAEETAE